MCEIVILADYDGLEYPTKEFRTWRTIIYVATYRFDNPKNLVNPNDPTKPFETKRIMCHFNPRRFPTIEAIIEDLKYWGRQVGVEKFIIHKVIEPMTAADIAFVDKANEEIKTAV